MAVGFRIFGPYQIDFGLTGLAPGETKGTLWYGWSPPPTQFTVTVSAIPATIVASSGSGTERASNSIAVSETSVKMVSYYSGGFPLSSLEIDAMLFNNGPAAIRYCSVFVSFIEL